MVTAGALCLVVEIGQAAEFVAVARLGLQTRAVGTRCVDQVIEALEGRVPSGQLIGVVYPLHTKTLPVAQGTSMAKWRRAKKVRFPSSWHAKSGKHKPCQVQCLSASAG